MADIEKLCSVFIKIRDARSNLKKEYDVAEARLKDQQDTISSCLLDTCKELNVSSLKTNAGTAFKTVKTRYWVNDWQAVEKFIVENNAFELMEKRIAQVAMKNWIEECPDNLPPSLTSDSKYQITIRRA
jgi:tetrahydrodipicolinate N-succinyltransferase